MSDIIKKIKIKKEDGTFTDYIPIGAEAENVNVDGESVKNKLNKKPYYYNSVADMQVDNNLKVGDMVITLGYYEANDGGRAEYEIVDAQDLINYQEILDNGLYATLVTHNNILYASQIGILPDVERDNTPILKNLYYNWYTFHKLVFGKGTYYFSECYFYKVSPLAPLSYKISWEGQSSAHIFATIFKPFYNNQRYIFKFGGPVDFSYDSSISQGTLNVSHFRIDNITFSDEDKPISATDGNLLHCGLICCDLCSFITSRDLSFYQCTGQPIYIRDSYEFTFDNLVVRNSENMNPEYSLIYIDERGYGGTSNLVFKHIDFERCKGRIFTTAANYRNCYIGDIQIEAIDGEYSFDDNYEPDEIIPIIRNEFIKNPYIYLKTGSVGNLTIDTINTDHFCNHYDIIDGQKYMRSVLKTSATRGGVHIKEINTIGTAYMFFESDTTEESYSGYYVSTSGIDIDWIGYYPTNNGGASKMIPRFYFTNYVYSNVRAAIPITIHNSNGILNADLVKMLYKGNTYIDNSLWNLIKLSLYTINRLKGEWPIYADWSVYIPNESDPFIKMKVLNDIKKIYASGKTYYYDGSSKADGADLLCKLYDDNDTLVQTITPTAHNRGKRQPFTEEFDFSNIDPTSYSYFKFVTTDVPVSLDYISCE